MEAESREDHSRPLRQSLLDFHETVFIKWKSFPSLSPLSPQPPVCTDLSNRYKAVSVLSSVVSARPQYLWEAHLHATSEWAALSTGWEGNQVTPMSSLDVSEFPLYRRDHYTSQRA